jgi:hypothetical protein
LEGGGGSSGWRRPLLDGLDGGETLGAWHGSMIVHSMRYSTLAM